MPTYSYACTACGHAFDIRQSFTDDALTVCPECGEVTLRKVIHPVGITFKGSGFYKTDSRASGKGGSASKPAADKTGGSGESSGSSQSGGTSGSGGAGASGSGSDSGSGAASKPAASPSKPAGTSSSTPS
jgi:putative FmdB family regulatory protein